MEEKGKDWGRKPFRMCDHWLKHPQFMKHCEKVWKDTQVQGWASFKVMIKMKRLKDEIKMWNKKVYQSDDMSTAELERKLEELDVLAGIRNLTNEESKKRHEWLAEVWTRKRDTEIMVRQRSRIDWLNNGDNNTEFFDLSAKERSRQNKIEGLIVNGKWIDDPMEVKEEVHRHFSSMFKARSESNLSLDMSCLKFSKLSQDSRSFLEQSFSDEEIKEAVRLCEGTKAPGPDGYNFNFIKEGWRFMEEDIKEVFKQFHSNGKLTKGMNSSFLVLIPKKKEASSINDLRPISLINSIYKIIAKVLAKRLQRVIGEIIGENQTAFVGGRQIMDGVMIVNELVDELKRSSRKGVILKLDFEKAYDRVDWKFLDNVMCEMGFGDRFRKWVSECLSTANISVLVNGSPTNEFQMERGLRQGDPMSPFLFLIVAEALSQMIKTAERKGRVQGVQVGSSSQRITHAQFADDTILFGSGAREEMEAFKIIFSIFGFFSGLKINFSKSCLYTVGIVGEARKELAEVMQCSLGRMPFRYLGVPIGVSPRKVSTWATIIESFKERLQGWEKKVPSVGGRLVMLNVVLSSLPLYYMSVFKAPDNVIAKLERFRRNFLWGGGVGERIMCNASWSKVCRSKECGGLGITSIKDKNLSMLGRWWWRFGVERNSLWRLVICNKYGWNEQCGSIHGVGPVKKSMSSMVWRDIATLPLNQDMEGVVGGSAWYWNIGEGKCISFWHDKWCGEKDLKATFPELFELSKNKQGRVVEFYQFNTVGDAKWGLEFRTDLNGKERSQFLQLRAALQQVKFQVGKMDCLRWVGEKDGIYSVAACNKKLEEQRGFHKYEWTQGVWSKGIKPKVQIFMWLAIQESLPVSSFQMLTETEFENDDMLCIYCDEHIETVSHVLVNCKFSWYVWCGIMNWAGVAWVQPGSVVELILQFGYGNKKQKEWIRVIGAATLWEIWRARNKLVNKLEFTCCKLVVQSAKLKAFKWLLVAGELDKSNVGQWMKSPWNIQQ